MSKEELKSYEGITYRQVDTGKPNVSCDKCAADCDGELCTYLSGGAFYCPAGFVWEQEPPY